MSRIIRSSKYRHVFGQPAKKEDCYDELKVSRAALDGNYIACSPLFFAVCWEASGGGAFAVLPYDHKGKFDVAHEGLVTGHKGPVLDLDFNPFNDTLVASVSEDCTAKVWGIPESGLTTNLNDALQTLNGHKRKVAACKFNPIANNILVTTSADLSVKIWDVENGASVFNFDGQHADQIQSVDWNVNGSLLVTTCKDKFMRIIDPRTNHAVSQAEAHQGIKPSKAIWLGDKGKLCSVGCNKVSEREYYIWDPKNLGAPVSKATIDSASGGMMFFYDNDTSILLLGGKGDGNIRYYEIVDEAPYIYFLTEFKSAVPQKGLCTLPKRAINVSECEIVKMLKLGTKTMEPISFQVPRKSDVFQDDIFPPTFSGEPTLSAKEWESGKNGDVKKISLEFGFTRKPMTEFKPVVQEQKELSPFELKQKVEELTKRVTFLEAELIKKDAELKKHVK